MADLAQRVYEIGAAERSAIDAASSEFGMPKGDDLSAFELDLRDWSVLFGLAYGIARGEDPYESNSSVARRAAEATRIAWQRWNGVSRPVREEV